MPKRKDNKEERAINILKLLVLMDEQDRDALPGSVVKKVKECVAILKKRRKGQDAKKKRRRPPS